MPTDSALRTNHRPGGDKDARPNLSRGRHNRGRMDYGDKENPQFRHLAGLPQPRFTPAGGHDHSRAGDDGR